MTATNEDTTSSATLVSDILISGGMADVDSSPASGIAVTSVTTGGTFQYSTDGITWNNFGSVSSTSSLLLTSSSRVRFIPNGNNGEVATFTYRGWDQTSGTASTNSTPGYANTNSNGSTTAYSSQSGSVICFASNVNDAPVLADTALTMTVAEDAGVPTGAVGSLISSFTGGISDVDSGAVKGIAITASVETNGTWYYTTNGGTNWTAVGTVNSTTSLLLADNANTRLYFAPGANYNGTSTSALTIRGWDQTSGSVGTKVDTSTNGTTTAFSSATDVIDVSVTAVNDAPTITNGYTHTLSGTNEDTNSTGTLASAILSGATWADVDTSALSGLAITGMTGNGTWQYSTDGTTWNNFGAVTSTNALLITSSTQVRYQPNGQNGETATFTYRAWDQTSGTASTNSTANYASTASNGGTTAFSSNTATASMVVTSVNDAPTITNGYTHTLTSTNEDTNSSGTLASAIFTGATWADVDTGAVSGLAITGMTGNGTWQYSTDGATWNNFGAVTSTNALLITSSTQVRYQPNGQNGETATFTYRAWDQTSGTASTNSTANYASTASNGGTTAFSSNTATASMVVTSVNDAPTITNGYTHTLTSTNEDTNSSGTLASAILTGATWADVDTGAISGLAITGMTGNGTWQYSTDGATWNNFGAVTSTNALLITSSTQVRYQPNGQNGETATFTYRAWDQTSVRLDQ